MLVPIDFSPQSDLALKQANILARQLNAMITCLYVIEKPGFVTGMLLSKELEKKIKKEAEFQLSSRVKQIIPESESIPVELLISSGKVYRKILEKASELQMNMIVMGNSESGGQKRRDIGSNTCRVVAKSPIPVIITHSQNISSFEHIILPLDLTDKISIKISKVLEIAEQLNARVTVCTFLDLAESKVRSQVTCRLKLINRIFADYGIDCQIQVIETEYTLSEEITTFARDAKADLIFMMTQEESNITEKFIGSTTHEVIRRSFIPVMSITPYIHTNLYPYKALLGEVEKHLDT